MAIKPLSRPDKTANSASPADADFNLAGSTTVLTLTVLYCAGIGTFTVSAGFASTLFVTVLYCAGIGILFVVGGVTITLLVTVLYFAGTLTKQLTSVTLPPPAIGVVTPLPLLHSVVSGDTRTLSVTVLYFAGTVTNL